MNRDEQFEDCLSRQSVKPVPPAWRAEILSAAVRATAAVHESRITNHGLLSTLNTQLSALLWPHPRAWAALGAVWVLIVAASVLTPDDDVANLARRDAVSTPRMEGILRQKEQMLAELVGFVELHEADQPKTFVPRPRSQRRNDFMEA